MKNGELRLFLSVNIKEVLSEANEGVKKLSQYIDYSQR